MVSNENQAQSLWAQACDKHLKHQVEGTIFRTFFEGAAPFLDGDQSFVLRLPNQISLDYVTLYEKLIEKALSTVAKMPLRLRFSLMQDFVPTPKETKAAPSSEGSELNSAYTFDSFVVGPGNNFANAACVAVAGMLGGQAYNPLFLYGASGLGKTHLMQAIGNYVKEHQPDKKVMYVQSEKFVNEFIQIIMTKQYNAFRNKYRQVDLLLIDDIQFIENKEQMQDEFFHTFNTLFEAGKNIVLTCDKPPASLVTLQDRLKTRISSGMIIDIFPPEYETRMAILKRLAEARGIVLPVEVTDYIATNFSSNIRELEGAFKTLMASCLLGLELNLDNCKKALKDLIQKDQSQALTADYIKTVVANYFRLSLEDLVSKKRNKEIVLARHVAMYLCHTLIQMPYAGIGQAFGGKHHATIMHAVTKISEELEQNPELSASITEIKTRLAP